MSNHKDDDLCSSDECHMDTGDALVFGVWNMPYGNLSTRERPAEYLKRIPIISGIVTGRGYHDRGYKSDRSVPVGSSNEWDAILIIP
jgi:hypothetical protein